MLRVVLTMLLISSLLSACAKQQHYIEPQAQAFSNEPTLDDSLQQAASLALGEREGTVIVIDPQNGRLRAVVNQRLAFEQTYPPGSAIKPFTALAAMRAGLLERESQRQCRTRYTHGDYSIICSHPKSTTPFNLAQALAYSCNYYFGCVGERLSEGIFNSTFRSFGFGERLGVSAAESSGTLPRGEWRVEAALGDSDRLLVTPIQLITAYAALVNGGHLYRPHRSNDSLLISQEITKLSIPLEHRAVLIEGMRGAVKYGTAAKASLGDLPFYVLGKTGTSTSSSGFRTQGWFVGFAAEKVATGVPKPEQIKLGVLVFLRRAHGSQCAEIAKPILNCGMRNAECGKLKAEPVIPLPEANLKSQISNHKFIKVRSVRENVVRELSLEEYLVGVVSSEASTETEFEALKAQAIVARTYALNNLGRHSNEGYDFCSLTHCQQYLTPKERLRGEFRRAVEETAGETLRDQSGNRAEAYFHAACGGVTANIEWLWGAPSPAPAHLRGVRDDFCATMPNRRWNQAIAVDQLRKALNSDERTSVGNRLDAIVVSKRDETGRAEILTIEGERRHTVRGWDFKIIVGRALGWQMIKSSRFEVSRAGNHFVFRGSGFGHGLGLCQNGAHVMAKRGMGYRQILQHYFPGTRLKAENTRAATKGQNPSDTVFALQRYHGVVFHPPRYRWTLRASAMKQALPTKFHTLSSENFRVIYSKEPAVANALRILENAHLDYSRRLEKASLQIPGNSSFEIVIHRTTADFIRSTGLSGWAAGATRGRRIELQPLRVLLKRKIFAPTLRHELAHAFIELLGNRRAPLWLAEGMAIFLAGEGAAMNRVQLKPTLSRDALEARLSRPVPASEARELYTAAYREVRALIQSDGEPNVWKLIARYGDGKTMTDKASVATILSIIYHNRRIISCDAFND